MKKEKQIKESKWVEDILQPAIQQIVSTIDSCLQVFNDKKLPYFNCVTRYGKTNKPSDLEIQSCESDLVIVENITDEYWTPRVLIETKLKSITSHDSIAYGQKAMNHKNIHPYLRYGVLAADYPDILPAPLIVHGGLFDFVMVWKKINPDSKETEQFINIIRSEIEASRQLEELIRTRRTKGKKSVYSLHRKLELGE